MSSKYLFDRPVFIAPEGGTGEKVSVCYLAYNNFVQCDVAVHEEMEIPVHNYRISTDSRPTLAHFYSVGELPLRWGTTTFCSKVLMEPKSLYPFLVRELMRFSKLDFIKPELSNIREAISWPTGYPTLSFIRLCHPRDSTLNYQKSKSATMIMRSCPQGTDFDHAFVKLHKMIVMEAVTRGFDPSWFPGSNLIKEVAALQCVRLMSAARCDAVFLASSDDLITTITNARLMYNAIHPPLLGNLKWTPVQGADLPIIKEVDWILTESEDETAEANWPNGVPDVQESSD
ncbi:nonstructural protein [Hedi virus]|uniref:nonstructural protein n=1 Tax=Hedi virus TaxID=2835654 RepID=UPI002483EB7B|nr:nonstructural protein [Hedi virus]QVG74818.1 nonstructural protein [Hedi virus]